MSRLERLARSLAADLSVKGEADWRRFVLLAKIVGQDEQRQPIAPSRRSGAPAGRLRKGRLGERDL
jgi:hypothetical protein